ncbi:ABC transporter substrate-binding protein [Azospirillum sp.]|uniref:ABC transporter substrate-binding protein n=1 Tax=Azospirillum sp. TaxID=34012 RepID=UPI002D2CA8E8|nr:ABC transporter substrate-binding protein [Azospirillum sp.]HYD71210.1 ABC transporter substrate-binding protein [Azospirillum sp.]
MKRVVRSLAGAVGAVAAIAVAGALAGVSGLSSAHAQQPQTVRIGVVQPMSGSLASYGQESQPVLQYMVDRINAEGGIRSMGGAKLQLVLADDAGKPALTAAEGRRLMAEEKVPLVVGSLFTNHLMALSPVADEHKVPTLSIYGAASQSPYIFALGLPYDRGYAQSMVDFIRWLDKEKGVPVKRVVTAYSNYEGAQQINKHITARLQQYGYEVVGDVPLDMKANDLIPAMLKIRSYKPDVVVGLKLRPEAVKLHRARHDLKALDGIFVEATGSADGAFWNELSDDIARQVLAKNFFALSLYAPTDRLPAARDLASAMDQSGKLPDRFGQIAVSAAQAILVVRNALEAAGSIDPEKLRAAIAAVNLPFGNPDMVFPRQGGVSFGEDRLTKHGETLVVQWAPNKTNEVVYPPAFATTAPRLGDKR